MINIDEFDESVVNTNEEKKQDGIDIEKLSLDVILGDRYEEYETLKDENNIQRKKNEELRATIESVKSEIETKKTKLLDEAAQEYKNLKSEEEMLKNKLDSLLGKTPTTEDII